MFRVSLCAAAMLATTMPAQAHDSEGHSMHMQAHDANEVEISGAFARATPPRAKAGVIYLSAESLLRDDVLLGGETEAADSLQLHTHQSEDGIMRMRRVEAVKLPKGEAVHFMPGGLHIMLVGLKAPLKKGESVAIELRFANAPDMQLDVPVMGISARASAKADHAGHGHSDHDHSGHEH